MTRLVKIFRYDPKLDIEGEYILYEIETIPGMSIMDVLEYVRSYIDPSLSYYSHSACRHGICDRCFVRINGKNGLACETPVPETKDLYIGPVSKDRVLKDLITQKRKNHKSKQMNEPLETALFSDADHFMIFSKNKEAVVAAYQDKLGFNLKYGGRNDSFGYENYIIGFGLVYLEILSLFDWKAGLANGMISGELADLFENRKALCLTYAMRTEKIDELANRVNQHGLEAIGPLSMERKRPDGKIPKWKLCLPGGITFRRAQIPFFVQWMTDDLERLSWEEPVSHPNGAVAITGFSIAVKDLNSVRKIYEDSFGCELYGEFDIRELNARCARYRVGQVFIDLISPSGEGPVKQFIEEVGDGPFEIKFKVEDINQTAAFFSKQKIKAEKEVIAENRLLVDDISLFGIRILFA